MRVLFVAPLYVNLDSNVGGVFNEMKAREMALNMLNVDVEYLRLDSSPDWNKIDCCHLFMANEGSYGLAKKIKAKKPIIVSPIIDRVESEFFLRLYLKLCVKLPSLHSNIERCYQICNMADGVMVRSQEEYDKVNNIFDINKNVKTIRIPFSFTEKKSNNKEKFVLFVGDSGNPRKNVKNLIKACEAKKINLIIAGIISEGTYGNQIINMINNSKHVQYVGKVSEDKKLELMQKAKVFALPSVMEGVGLAAIEAIENGCNLVITRNGGVRDYFGNSAIYVDPANVSEISDAIEKSIQIDFSYEYSSEFSFEEIGESMLSFYKEILNA